jgi:hypothetical protein
MPQICNMRQTALLSLQRKACCGFYRPKNQSSISHRNWSAIHPSRPYIYCIYISGLHPNVPNRNPSIPIDPAGVSCFYTSKLWWLIGECRECRYLGVVVGGFRSLNKVHQDVTSLAVPINYATHVLARTDLLLIQRYLAFVQRP